MTALSRAAHTAAMSSGEPPVELSSDPRDAVPAPEVVVPVPVAGAPRRFSSWRSLVLLLALTLPLAAMAGVAYGRYAAVHLRGRPSIPRCVLQARAGLRKPAAASGSEPRQTAAGETVYLTPNEDRAVACAFQLDELLSRHLAAAFAEQDPALRAAGLLAVVRDRIPSDPAHDPEAFAGYLMTSAAMRAPWGRQRRPNLRWTILAE